LPDENPTERQPSWEPVPDLAGWHLEDRAHGRTPQPTTRADFTAFMKKESAQWAAIIKERKRATDW